MLGQMQDQIVAPCLQGSEQRQLGLQMADRAQLFPLAIDAMHFGNRRMQCQHFLRIGIDQRIDLGMRRVLLQHRKHRRRQQHVTVVTQFDDQNPPHFFERDGIAQRIECFHPVILTARLRIPAAGKHRRESANRSTARAAGHDDAHARRE